MIFPPDTISRKKPVQVYYKYLCRNFPMIYEKEVKFPNGTAYKYVLPENVFDSPESNAENQCFCEAGTCPPQGLLNSTLCADGEFKLLPKFPILANNFCRSSIIYLISPPVQSRCDCSKHRDWIKFQF